MIFVVFVLSNLPFALLDLTGWPSSLLKYKIQEEKAVPVSQLKSICTESSSRLFDPVSGELGYLL